MPPECSATNRRQWLQRVSAAAVTASCQSFTLANEETRNEIWDSHVHLAGFEGNSAEAKTDNLLEFADRMGIARLAIFMGWPWAYSPTPEQMRKQNDQVLAALRHAPDRLFGYVYLNQAHAKESLEELRRCLVDGPMVGIKLWVARRCNDDSLDPILEEAVRWSAPIYQHTWIKTTGNLDGESTPEDLVLLAQRHPEAKLICGHSGGNWELGMRIIQKAPSVMFEIAGADPTAGVTERAVAELGARRVLYGSDAGGRSLATQLSKIFGAEIPEEEKALILGGNLRTMLEPILRAKGMRP